MKSKNADAFFSSFGSEEPQDPQEQQTNYSSSPTVLTIV